MCMAHLYGVALYYATSLVEMHFSGLSHSRPEFMYFWVYYVGFNLPWAIIPACKFRGVADSYLPLLHSPIPCLPDRAQQSCESKGGNKQNVASRLTLLQYAVLLFDSVKTLRRKLRSLDAIQAGLAGFQAHTALNSAKATSETKKGQ